MQLNHKHTNTELDRVGCVVTKHVGVLVLSNINMLTNFVIQMREKKTLKITNA